MVLNGFKDLKNCGSKKSFKTFLDLKDRKSLDETKFQILRS